MILLHMNNKGTDQPVHTHWLVIFLLVSLAEHADLSLTWSQGFSRRSPISTYFFTVKPVFGSHLKEDQI